MVEAGEAVAAEEPPIEESPREPPEEPPTEEEAADLKPEEYEAAEGMAMATGKITSV